APPGQGRSAQISLVANAGSLAFSSGARDRTQPDSRVYRARAERRRGQHRPDDGGDDDGGPPHVRAPGLYQRIGFGTEVRSSPRALSFEIEVRVSTIRVSGWAKDATCVFQR